MNDTVEILVDNEDGVLSPADVVVALAVAHYDRLLEKMPQAEADKKLLAIAEEFDEGNTRGLPEWMFTARIRQAAESANKGTFFEETDWMQDVLTSAIEDTLDGGFVDYLDDHPGVIAIFR